MNYTKRILCAACRTPFTITGSACKFCKNKDCISRRRKADRLTRKQGVAEGSAQHLARALKTGD